jgi:hypothetical protein
MEILGKGGEEISLKVTTSIYHNIRMIPTT